MGSAEEDFVGWLSDGMIKEAVELKGVFAQGDNCKVSVTPERRHAKSLHLHVEKKGEGTFSYVSAMRQFANGNKPKDNAVQETLDNLLDGSSSVTLGGKPGMYKNKDIIEQVLNGVQLEGAITVRRADGTIGQVTIKQHK